jgi:hypothetical protein
MDQEKTRRDAVGRAGWALCIALGALASVGVCGAEQFGADSAAGSRVQIETPQIQAPPIQAPIDATMVRLRQLEKVAGFDPTRLSAASRNLFSLADRWTAVRARLVKGMVASAEPEQTRTPGADQMSQILATDLRNSRYSGFTQSETATAWCGTDVVMGFNDSGAEGTTMASGRGVSMDGYALSSNRGATFTYMGSPATPSDPNTFMSGDPVVACANAATFYYVSGFLDGTNGISGVGVSTSTDGGKSFATPVVIGGQPSNTHIVDGAWIAVDHSAPNRLYVTYTDLDFSGSICGTENSSAVPRYAIETVSSADGGMTWSDTPVVIAQVCADSAHTFAFVDGARVAVGPSGEVYVAWELFNSTSAAGAREIEISQSTDQAQSFPASPVTVATIGCAGDCADWQGLAHSNEHPSLAIGKGPHSGIVYLAWNDGNRQVPDALTTTGFYNFTDIMFSQSSDAGATWSTPVRVNNNREGGTAPLTDQFEPALAADISGRIAICFYDRRRDPANFRIDRFCASSPYGKNWSNNRITFMQFPTVVGQDVLLAPDYMGDYDTLASDGLDRHAGFVGGFATNLTGNPIVKAFQY